MSSQFLPASRPGYHPRNRRSLALGVGAATLVAAHVHAQAPQGQRDPSYVHESWTVKDGLPVNSINAILQDRTGYIWIATFDGLVRFDGIRFTVFNSVRSAELPSNRIVQLHEGRDGTLWVATAQGHVVRFRDGQFTNLPFENGADTYTYLWKTEKSWAGTCRALVVKLTDGTEHTADFQFKK